MESSYKINDLHVVANAQIDVTLDVLGVLNAGAIAAYGGGNLEIAAPGNSITLVASSVLLNTPEVFLNGSGAQFKITANNNATWMSWPNVSTADRDSFITSPLTGDSIYNIDDLAPQYYNGTSWVTLSSGGGLPPGLTFSSATLDINALSAFVEIPAIRFLEDGNPTVIINKNPGGGSLEINNTDGAVLIEADTQAQIQVNGGSFNWVFDASGNFTAPGTIATAGAQMFLQQGTLVVGPSVTPAVSPAVNNGIIYFDDATKKFLVSEDGGAFVDMISAGGTLNYNFSTTISAASLNGFQYPSFNTPGPVVTNFAASSNTAPVRITLTGNLTTDKSDVIYVTIMQDGVVNLAETLTAGSGKYFQAVKGVGDYNGQLTGSPVIIPVCIDIIFVPGDTAPHSYLAGISTSDGSNGIIWNDNSSVQPGATVTVEELVAGGGGGGVTYPLTAPDGSLAAPSYSFASGTSTGMWLQSPDSLKFVVQGVDMLTIFNDNATPKITTTWNMEVNAIFCNQYRGTGEITISVEEPNSDLQLSAGPTSGQIILNQAVRLPGYNNAGRDAISNVQDGLLIFNADTGKLNFYSGAGWQEVTSTPV